MKSGKVDFGRKIAGARRSKDPAWSTKASEMDKERSRRAEIAPAPPGTLTRISWDTDMCNVDPKLCELKGTTARITVFLGERQKVLEVRAQRASYASVLDLGYEPEALVHIVGRRKAELVKVALAKMSKKIGVDKAEHLD